MSENDSGWSPAAGNDCDDNNLCTYDDQCGSDGNCNGTPIECTDEAGTCGANRTCNGTNQCEVTYPENRTPCDSDNIGCTDDVCQDGGCKHLLQSNSCFINASCRANGAPNPSNECQYCNATNPNDWSNYDANHVCSDGIWCNDNDTCNGFGDCTDHDFPGNTRCGGGDTCNNTCNEQQQNCFSPSTQPCGNWTEYRCQNGCSGNVESRQATQFCTGFSDECTGTIDYGDGDGWGLEEECTDSQVCSGDINGATCTTDFRCACEDSSETYYDDNSGLCWEIDHSSILHSPTSGATYCAGRDTGDFTDWELPNIADLITLIRGCQNGWEESIDELSLCQLEVDGVTDPMCWEDESCNGVEMCSYCDEGAGPANGCYWPMELEGTCSHHYSTLLLFQ